MVEKGYGIMKRTLQTYSNVMFSETLNCGLSSLHLSVACGQHKAAACLAVLLDTKQIGDKQVHFVTVVSSYVTI